LAYQQKQIEIEVPTQDVTASRFNQP
jgi:hypothetical protein